MTGNNAQSFACFVFDQDQLPGDGDLLQRNGDEEDDIESIGNESMVVHVNNSEVISNDDNNSVTQIDPGNFSESDIDEDVSSNYAPSNGDGFGGFPESDIEDEDDEMSDAESLSLSFASDVGSPMHSSTRSYPVSEDREDEREEATPLPAVYAGFNGDEFKAFNTSFTKSRKSDYETINESERSAGDFVHSTPKSINNNNNNNNNIEMGSPIGPAPKRQLRTATMAKRRSLMKVHIHHQKKRYFQHHNKKKETVHSVAHLGNNSITSTPPPPVVAQYSPPISELKKFVEVAEHVDGEEGSATRSLSIPILDLCITEDEGYLGMGEEDTSESDKDLSQAQITTPLNPTTMG